MKSFIILTSCIALVINAHDGDHQAHVDAKIPQFRSNKLRASEFLTAKKPDNLKWEKEFYIQNEFDAEFGSFNVSLSVDIIWVNDQEKPRYSTDYP